MQDPREVRLSETPGGQDPPLLAILGGNYYSDSEGEEDFGPERLQRFADNFNADARQKKIPIDIEHEPWKGALGYARPGSARVADYVDRNGVAVPSLFVDADWTKRGREVVESGEFLYVSPAFYLEWTNPRTRVTYQDVLSGIALTTNPYLCGQRDDGVLVTYSERKTEAQKMDGVTTRTDGTGPMLPQMEALADGQAKMLREYGVETKHGELADAFTANEIRAEVWDVMYSAEDLIQGILSDSTISDADKRTRIAGICAEMAGMLMPAVPMLMAEKDEEGPTLAELVAELNATCDKVKPHVKGKKGAVSLRHMLSRALKDLEAFLPDPVAESEKSEEVATILKGVSTNMEDQKILTDRLAKAERDLAELRSKNRKMAVEAHVASLVTKGVLKSAESQKATPVLLALAEADDVRNDAEMLMSENGILAPEKESRLLAGVLTMLGEACHRAEVKPEIGTSHVSGEPVKMTDAASMKARTEQIMREKGIDFVAAAEIAITEKYDGVK